jgi:biotin carboxyl carrier protein
MPKPPMENEIKKNEELGFLNINTSLYKTRLSQKFLNRKQYSIPDTRLVLSFIPGTVLKIYVKVGQVVQIGDDLLILEAMKMKNQLKCSTDGKIKRILTKEGDKVSKGTLLLEIE